MRKEYAREEPGDGVRGKRHAAYSLPEDTSRALKRLLANGPLAAVPKRPAVANIEPAKVLAEMRSDRESRKRKHGI